MPEPDGPQFYKEKPKTLTERAKELSAAMEGLPKRQHRMHPSSMQAILGLGSMVTIPMGGILKPEVESIRPTGKTPFPPPLEYRHYYSGKGEPPDPRNLLEKERYVSETPPARVRYHDESTPHYQHYKRLQWDATGSVFMGNPTLSEQMRGAYRGRPDSPNFDPIYAGTPPWHKPALPESIRHFLPALHSAPPKWESPKMPDRWPYSGLG